MTSAPLSAIEPPPSVADVLGALTDDARIGKVDFSTRLIAVPEDQSRPEPGSTVTLVPEREDDEAGTQSDAAVVEPEPYLGVEPESTPLASGKLQRKSATRAAQVAAAAAKVAAEVAAVGATVDEGSFIPAPPAPALPAEPVPTASTEVEHEFVDPQPTVDEIARGVVERMHDAELAMMRHLDAVLAEADRRCELLTTQAELDAELIRLNARREAHAIVAAARERAEERGEQFDDGGPLDELTESLSNFADVVDELRPIGRPGRGHTS